MRAFPGVTGPLTDVNAPYTDVNAPYACVNPPYTCVNAAYTSSVSSCIAPYTIRENTTVLRSHVIRWRTIVNGAVFSCKRPYTKPYTLVYTRIQTEYSSTWASTKTVSVPDEEHCYVYKARSNRSIPIGLVEIQRKNFILTYSSIMRLGRISTIYVLNLVNTLLFDSLARYSVAWILGGIIMLLLERGQDCSSKVIEMFVSEKIDYVNFLYKSLRFMGAFIFIGFGTFLAWSVSMISAIYSK